MNAQELYEKLNALTQEERKALELTDAVREQLDKAFKRKFEKEMENNAEWRRYMALGGTMN